MSVRSFIDTNVLVYTDDEDYPDKQRTAVALVGRCRREKKGVISGQILQEYFSVATRKLKIPAEKARRKIDFFARFQVVLINVEDIMAAIDLHHLNGFSFWDSLVIRAALRSGCGVLYSEDLQAGQRFEGLEIVNPFL